jgi:REP element-mobilizing transposase RayT
MPRQLRYQSSPWGYHLATTRCTQGYSFLIPSDALNALVAGCIGRALERHLGEVELYSYVVMPNHIHLLMGSRTTHAKARFMCHLNSNIARELCRDGGWRDHIWEGRYHSHELLDESALISAYQYLFKNSVKEGLVDHPSEWPGLHAWAQLCGGERVVGAWVDRTGFYNAQQTLSRAHLTLLDFTHEVEVRLSRPPLWEAWSDELYRARCVEWCAQAMAEVAEALVVSAGEGAEPRGAMGAEAVRSLQVFVRRSPPVRKRRPLCRSGCVVRFVEYMRAYRDFRDAFLEVSGRFRDAIARGERLPRLRFPEGGAPVFLGRVCT